MTEDVREGDVLAGKYRVERLLGQGGMGSVYLAKHVELEEHVALKLMLPAATRSGEAVARFMREARSAAKIKSQHVVRVSDVGVLEGSRPYMAMEYLEGADLQQILAERRRLPLEETAEYVLQALEALSEAHVLGITHRDLKPGNLFITRRHDGTPVLKVLDFGISKVANPGDMSPSNPLTQVSALVGSPLYMSPEQMKASKDVDHRADIWALGIIMHELLTGEVPFKAESLPELCALIVLEGEPPRTRNFVPELPDGIDLVIGRCLARKVSERFANAAELARALVSFAPARARVSVDRIAAVLTPASLRGGSVSQSNPQTPPSSTPASWGGTASVPAKRQTPLVLAAVLALVAVGGVTALALRGGSSDAPKSPAAAPVAAEAPKPAPVAAPAPTPAVGATPAPATSAKPTAPTPVVTPATSGLPSPAAASAKPAAASAKPATPVAKPPTTVRPTKKPPEPQVDELHPFGGRH